MQRAFVYSFEEMAKNMCNNYLDNVEAYCNKEKMQRPDHRGGDRARRTADALDRRADRHLRKREEHVPAGDPDSHLVAIRAKARPFEYNSHERLKEAIEKKIFAGPERRRQDHDFDQDARRRSAAPHQRGRRPARQRHGYCTVCANELLTYVGTLLSR